MVLEATRTVGRFVPRLDGVRKVTGAARYTMDIPIAGCLWGKVLRSPLPHARIVRIDSSRARALPGVVCVLTGADIPPALFGRRVRDIPALCRDRVRFVGDRVAAVAAETREAAEEALALIEVEYEELPAIFDPEAALQPDASLVHDDPRAFEGAAQDLPPWPNLQAYLERRLGEVERGFDESDYVFEHTFTTPRVHQLHLEPNAAAVYVEPNGLVNIWCNNKAPFNVRQWISEAESLPPESVVVHVVHIGGDFGGKGAPMDTPTCYYLARAVGRPVRMVLTNPEELTQANPGHPSIIKLRTGVKKDGRIWARQAEVLSDGGAYCGFVPRPAPKVTDPADVCGPYRIPHILLQSTMVYTNNVPCGNYRGPGAPQAFFAGESQLDIICRELGWDPIELRIRNALHDEDLAPDGERWLDFRLDQALELAREASGWDPTAQRPPNSGRGVAVSFYSTGVGVSGTDLELDAEGRVKVTTGTPDTGTGSHTVLQQIVAEVLSLPPDQIEVRAGHTNEAQPDSGSGADRVTHIAGRATQLAAEQLREQLQELAAEYLGCPPAAVELVDGQARDRERPGQAIAVAELAARAASGGQPLTASASFSSAEVVGNKTVSAYIIDVSVDPESGQVRLTHLTAVHDVGTVIHPVNLEGQLEGGMVMGFGYALSETLPVEDGRVTAGSLAEYKIACQQDIPSLTMRLITDAPGPGPYGAKGIGELVPGALPAAIANAVHDAIGVRILDLPITAEKIRAQLTQPPPKRLPSVSATSGADRS